MAKAPAAGSATFDPALEGLRGLACLIVLFGHFLSEPLDPHFRLPQFWVENFALGHEAVFLFFLLSGYVIGLVSLRTYSKEARSIYLWKRFVRLVPLYWLVIFISVVVYPADSWKTILPQLFFLQNTEPYLGIRLTVLKANTNLWSLNYEIVYYLTFLLVWKWRPGRRALGGLIFALAAVGLTGWIFPHQPKILTGYAVGGMFWYSGLWMIWHARQTPETNTRPWPWISIGLLLLITPHLAALNVGMKGLGLAWPTDPDFPYVSFRDLQVLPIGLIILAGATRRELPLAGLMWTLAWVQPLGLIAWDIVAQNHAALDRDGFSMIMAAFALIFVTLRFEPNWLALLCPVGLISYGVYIFARPVQWLVFQHLETFSGTWESYVLRCVAVAALTLLAGYVAELIIQPRVRGWLNRKLAPTSHNALSSANQLGAAQGDQ